MKGAALLRGGRRFRSGGGLAALVAPLFARVLDHVDAGLVEGRIEATLPNGTQRILGNRAPGPVAIVDLRSYRALVRLWRAGSVGWYVAWERGEWASPDPVPLFDLFMRNRVPLGQTARAGGLSRATNRMLHWLQRNTPKNSRRNIEAHYDLGNDFYRPWLDAGMSYSSALFGPGDTLEAAQHRKIAALLDRVEGKTLLDIGCGWGAVAEVATTRGFAVTGITLSREQRAYAADRVPSAHVSITDYRDVTTQFDAVTSVEMVEAVGQDYWPAWMDTVARCLKPGGRAALQFISIADDIFDRYAANADFIQTYIFPGGLLISESRFRALADARGLDWQDEHRFGLDYAETLKLWRERFDAAAAAKLLPPEFDNHFMNLWRYYLMYCEGGFRGGGIDVLQVTLVKA
ncbi:Cyclopropane-fatty-acyl-phospholipid synthase [Sphingomonas antarctica]|uniref:class I SAM-dependent methyltransferase n=1 Tax=Sphingomonas antarctica TaxID=2040274 RepID=UPI0039E9CC46